MEPLRQHVRQTGGALRLPDYMGSSVLITMRPPDTLSVKVCGAFEIARVSVRNHFVLGQVLFLEPSAIPSTTARCGSSQTCIPLQPVQAPFVPSLRPGDFAALQIHRPRSATRNQPKKENAAVLTPNLIRCETRVIYVWYFPNPV